MICKVTANRMYVDSVDGQAKITLQLEIVLSGRELFHVEANADRGALPLFIDEIEAASIEASLAIIGYEVD